MKCFFHRRWIPADNCIRIEIETNKFILLPSVTDNYFTYLHDDDEIRNREHSVTSSHQFTYFELQLNKENHRTEGNAEKSYLVNISYKNFSKQLITNIIQYPDFYLSTSLSASLHDENQCLIDLQEGNIEYHKKDCFSYLGKYFLSSADLLSRIS